MYIYNIGVDFDQRSDFEGFDWDQGNRDKNQVKHNVSDGECEEIFFNSPLLMIGDTRHSDEELRFAAFGVTKTGRMLTVVFTMRQRLVRVISARDMNKKERNIYEKFKTDTQI